MSETVSSAKIRLREKIVHDINEHDFIYLHTIVPSEPGAPSSPLGPVAPGAPVNPSRPWFPMSPSRP